MARYKIDCCLNCPKRHVGCHSECEAYKTQRAEYDATMAEKRKKYDISVGLNGFMYDNIERTNRKLNYRSKYRKNR